MSIYPTMPTSEQVSEYLITYFGTDEYVYVPRNCLFSRLLQLLVKEVLTREVVNVPEPFSVVDYWQWRLLDLGFDITFPQWYNLIWVNVCYELCAYHYEKYYLATLIRRHLMDI